MTKLYRRFTSLDRSDRILVLRAASLMALVWTGLRVLRFGTLRRLLERYAESAAAGGTHPPDAKVLDRVRWAITAVANRFPSATCLVQALTGEVMLRRRGLDCQLRIGVRGGCDSAVSIEAHAWVECQGAVAIGAVDNLSTFRPLTAPGPHDAGDSQAATELFAGLLKGDALPWRAFRMAPEEFVRACAERGLTCLIYERLRGLAPEHRDWPQEIRDALATMARKQTAKELLRQKELMSVLALLATENVQPILLKGAGLAYSLYSTPASRPRFDTDLLIRRDQVDAVLTSMVARGYTSPAHCGGDLLFCQFPLRKTDAFGVLHALDVHWKISTQPVFADVLGFDEIAAVAMDLPPLGASARTAGLSHALLLACIHPVMHHRNVESLIWIYDIHLLASRLSDQEFDRFAELAVARQLSAICAHQLSGARRRFGTPIPDSVMMKLTTVRASEPSAAYLRSNRTWANELVSSVRGLPSWIDRLRLLREVTLPGPAYMLKAYGVAPSSLRAAFLPALYIHRLASGGWRALSGQK